MAKFAKPVLTAVLALCLLAGAAAAEADLHPYIYRGSHALDSVQRYDFQYVGPDGRGDGWRDRNSTVGLFRLERTDGTEEDITAYCCDFLYRIKADTRYRRLNLEDCTYFPAPYAEAMAGHIRGIFRHGYWPDWTEADTAAAAAAANEWLMGYEGGTLLRPDTGAPLPGDAEEPVVEWVTGEDGTRTPVPPICDFTADDAFLATQLAIWGFANTEAEGYWLQFRGGGGGELSQNVRAFRKYLLHQSAAPLTPEELLFSDDCFTTSTAAITTGVSEEEGIIVAYDIDLFFRLAGSIDDADDLLLTAAAGSGEPRALSLHDLTPEESGYYRLSFTGVSPEDAAQGIHLTLTGRQMAEGVYFYEALAPDEDDTRSASQNLVGRATGMTPVRAETTVAVEPEVYTGALRKVDGSGQSPAPLAGAVFDLYVLLEETYVPLRRGLVTDADGCITVDTLSEGYEYYLKETAAPEGFLPCGDYVRLVPGETVELANDPAPQPPPPPPVPPTPPADGPDEARWYLPGSKTLDGRPAGGYTFRMVCPDGREIHVRSRADGVIPFPAQYYDEAGTYTYSFSEVAGEEADISYDPAAYTAVVTVGRSSGGFAVTDVALRRNGEPAQAIAFANTTTPHTGETEDPPQSPPPAVSDPPQSDPPPALPSSPEFSQVPATGDTTGLWQAAALLSASALLTMAVAADRRRRS